MLMEDLIKKLLNDIKSDLTQDQVAKGLTASGASASSLEVTKDGELLGAESFYYQIYGRAPGRFPPIQNILDWIEAKRIDTGDISKKSLAFLIARKIAREGTRIYRGEAPGLDFEKITDDNMKLFDRELKDKISTELSKIWD
jgi:hypothetical protein